ncbi:MAG: N-6 DNA methylase [Bacteroidetes bacterium]|nr:N-6 DNA methylase [Bacteroidota bacterium]
MSKLNNIDFWKNHLGLLPINLFSAGQQNKYILLNGGYGDFCVDINSDKTPDEYYSFAWSSNTKNFVTLKDDKISLFNWLKEKEENYKLSLVQENLPKFYNYLQKDSYKSEYDIVPFIVDIYRSLRNLTNEDKEGIQAINQLLLLLVAYEENKDLDKIDFNNWGILNTEMTTGLESYLDSLRNGLFFNNKKLKPNLDLVLRHSSGHLFQEAQKEAFFYNRALTFWGTYDSNYESKNKLYSSFHYTPSYLARSIVEYSLSKLNLEEKNYLKIFDPACGSSQFLLEVLKQLKSRGYTGKIEIIGWDSSESAIIISNFLLTYEKREWADNLTINIEKVENSLSKEWDNDYDLIFMNPPFRSWELMVKNDREIVSNILGEKSRKKPNLASAFVFKSVQNLKEDGILGTVIPSSILLMDSYKNLRDEIKEALSLLLVGKLGNFIFEHALTDVSILVGKKPKSNNVPLLLWTKNEKDVYTDVFRDLRKITYNQLPYVKDNPKHSIYIPDSYPDNENWKINLHQELGLKRQLHESIALEKLKSVQEIFNVIQGVRTGNNKVFKISKQFFYELPESERKYFRPVVDNDSINRGLLKTVNYSWFPYTDKKKMLINTEEELTEKVTTYYGTVLSINKESLINRKKNVPFWWSLSDCAPRLLPNPIKLISTEFGKSGSFAFDEKGEFTVERGNAWLPKKEFENKDYYYFYLSLFNSPFFEKLLSIYSKQLAGGRWYDLGKMHTKDIPIPLITKELESTFVFEKLVHFGKLISKGEYFHFEINDDYLKNYIYQVE